MGDQGRGGRLSPYLRARRLQKVAAFVRGKVLDFGCGTGELLHYSQPNLYVGFDTDSGSVGTARSNHPDAAFFSDLGEALGSGAAYDVIVLAAVIEHLEDPVAVLHQLKAGLAPSGVIVLTTPHPAWRRLHDVGARMGLFSLEASREHKAFLDQRQMLGVAAKAGLQILRTERFLFGANQLYVLGRPPEGAGMPDRDSQ